MPKMTIDSNLHITVLGSGTSTGVPVIGCSCDTCTSEDPRDKRTRCSLYIRYKETGIIVDTGPDFRQQVLKHKIDDIDAIIYTHLHNDHIIGFDDIRGYNFSNRKSVPAYAHQETADALKRIFPYAFGEVLQSGGGLPVVPLHIINNDEFTIGDITIQPLELWHGKLEVKGFRIGNFAYCTDTNFIPAKTYSQLKDLEYLIIDGLRPEAHPTHFNIEQSLEAIEKIAPKKAYLTHIAHQIKHSRVEPSLPENVSIAYDGLEIKLFTEI